MSAVIPIKEVEYEHPLPGNTCDTKFAWARIPAEPGPAWMSPARRWWPAG